ncbi:MAG: N-methyl-L-tryptophan oxidase [Candidatus Sericytochromatia bacterium]|nr:N-methyl-L-tryptophan oxidase [Candidatus Sericytochromatia bacterium]
MENNFDVIVVGLGAMGSSACYYLSQNNINVLGLDQFNPPHNFGSSHGETRIIREAYFEHPLYVPLVQRAYDLWEDLQQKTTNIKSDKLENNESALLSDRLFLKTSGLMLGKKDSGVVSGAKKSAETHNLNYKLFNSDQIKKNYPAFNIPADNIGILENRAGILFPEKCIKKYLEYAKNKGVKINYNEKMISWKSNNSNITVTTDKNVYYTDKLILSTGAWIKEIIPNLKLKITRQVLFWLDTKGNDEFKSEKFPIYICEKNPEKIFYGFPDLGTGMKIAFHNHGQEIKPDNLDKNIYSDEIKEISDIVGKYFPKLKTNIIKSEVCMYTNTEDENFIIDYYPSNNNVIVASPCSGHGFKFSSAIGEILSQMANNTSLKFDLDPFKIQKRLNR